MKALLQLSILLTSLSIVACGNPTNTQTNPLKKYQNRANDVPVRERGEDVNIGPAIDDGNPLACPKPYTMHLLDADGKDAGRSLQFTVGQSKSYNIDLTSSQFKDIAVSLPKNAPLKLSRTKSGDYSISFSPTAAQDNMSEKVRLLVSFPQTGCNKGMESELLTVNVNSGKPLPSVAILNLDQERRYGSTDSIPFDIEVTDPALTDGKTPNFPEFTYKNTFATGETAFTSAEGAISCNHSAKVSDFTYRFNCLIDASKIKNPFQNQSDVNTSFQVFARSISNDLSDSQDASLTFHFPVELPAPAQTTPAPTAATTSSPSTTTDADAQQSKTAATNTKKTTNSADKKASSTKKSTSKVKTASKAKSGDNT